MAYEQKEGSGALFKNDKGDNPKRPDYRGDITLGGVKYDLAAWIKEGNKGKFMSISGKVQETERREAPAATAPAQPPKDFDDDIPF
jgi:hypothetical protein